MGVGGAVPSNGLCKRGEGKLRDVPANSPFRCDGGAVFSWHAQHCGFWGEIETVEFPPDAKCGLAVGMAPGRLEMVLNVQSGMCEGRRDGRTRL